jgi:hypothetical protein
MASAAQQDPGKAVGDMRHAEGESSASTEASASDAIIWASLHGLVLFLPTYMHYLPDAVMKKIVCSMVWKVSPHYRQHSLSMV